MPVSDQGVSRDRYMLIPRVLIFVTRGDAFLLLKGASSKRLWANRYNGLGGHVEPGEDILCAARRELYEEAGLIADLRLCGTLMVDTRENPGIGIFILAGECSMGEPRPSPEGTLHWMNVETIDGLPGVDDLPRLVRHIRGMKRESPPFSARSFYDESGCLQLEFAPDQLNSAP